MPYVCPDYPEPADVKRAVDARQSRLYRGYNSLEDGAHNCKRGMGTRDGKESFVVGMEEGTSPMHGKNQWPADDKFRQNIEPYFAAVRDAGLAVARGLALSLGLDESFFLDRLTSPVAQMVLLRYEAESRIDKAAVGDTIGCGAHTDCGFLTLLVQDSTPGLEVQLPQTKEWVSAPARPGCLLVNLGDMVSAWTDGALVSTTHRVVSHPTQARQSIVVFMNPDFDAAMRAGTTCGQYLLSKLGLMWLDAPSAPAPE